jgi:hypothetical protein
MKLPLVPLNLQEQLAEFDLWITPSIREIQDSEKFRSELAKVDSLIKNLGSATENFASIESCSPEAIASTCVEFIEQSCRDLNSYLDKLTLSADILESLCSLLFMVTGKSDNNLKCQFPVYLLQSGGRLDFPHRIGNSANFQNKPIGRTVKSDKLSKLVADALLGYDSTPELRHLENDARWLLGKYVAAILKDESSIQQFWALGKSYFTLLELNPGTEKALLAPIVIFKVRGSVSASGGHIPEDILRDMMDRWGLVRGVDFNIEDVIIQYQDETDISKTRAYDFVLPYRTPSWEPKIFIQCQFYAGDSGSVSHKVVDQTKASRPSTMEIYPSARFLEYLDGAGYYSALNTDLQHMLGMATTKDFLQIRSAHIKLRREIQDIGFLTLLEVEHAIFRSTRGDSNDVVDLLVADGYSTSEINRVLSQSMSHNLLGQNVTQLFVTEGRLTFARQLFVLDLVAVVGEQLGSPEACAGSILIPGYGAYYGKQLNAISNEIGVRATNLIYSRNDFANDITFLSEEKFIVLR